MRNGFTTGSCAAAAAKAAAYMLLGGNRISRITIDTPAGVRYTPQLENIMVGEEAVSCGVRKDAGDDPDITDGALICATVRILSEDPARDGTVSFGTQEDTGTGIFRDESRIFIEGGAGVGTVTRPGLDQPVGNAAINSVPRQMIEKEIREVMDLFDFRGVLSVEISVPGGAELAQKTFNPRLGIVGGISIIGTTGVVEPMSTRALLETIRTELNQVKAMGASAVVISPGNYGLAFMRERYRYDLDKAVKCSNYIGAAIDMAADLGFQEMLLCGHVGKLIKVSGGIMNTHSREADCRMELMAAAAARCGASAGTLRGILDSVSTEEAFEYCLKEGIGEQCCRFIMEKIEYYLNKRAGGRLKIHCIVYSNRYGLMGATEEAQAFLEKIQETGSRKGIILGEKT